MPEQPSRPIPVLRGEERTYFEHARERRLVHQLCGACGHRVFYLRTVCQRCTSPNLSIQDSAGTGTVYSFSTQHRPGHPYFADRVPYTIVLVDLDEGVRVLSDLVDCEPQDVSIGMRVEVLFEDVTDDLTLPRFRPTADAGTHTGIGAGR